MRKILAMIMVIFMMLCFIVVMPINSIASFDGDKPMAAYDNLYDQSFSDTWDGTKFYDQWVFVGDPIKKFAAADVVNGGIKFYWVDKRIIASKNTYTLPYIFEVDMERYTSGGGNNGAGPIIRANTIDESLQEFGNNDFTTYNHEGIAFYSSKDGTKLNIQFSGTNNGVATIIQAIPITAPAGVNFYNRGILRIEDFGTTIYAYFNNAPLARIDLGGKTGNIYTSGTVYNADMAVAGTFTNKEVEVSGKIAIAQRDAGITIYKATVKWATDYRVIKRDALKIDIANASLLPSTYYTPQSWVDANLTAVISAAQATYDNVDATVEQLDAAIVSIADAIELLEAVDRGYLALDQPFTGQSISQIYQNWILKGSDPNNLEVAPINNDGITIGPATSWFTRVAMLSKFAYKNYEMSATLKVTLGDKATLNLRQVQSSDCWEGDRCTPERTGYIGAVINFNSGVTNKIDLTIRNGSCQINQGGSRVFIPDIALPAGANITTGVLATVKDTGDKIEFYINNTLVFTIVLNSNSLTTGRVQVSYNNYISMPYYSSGTVTIASSGTTTNFTNSVIPVIDKTNNTGIIAFANRVGTMLVKNLKIYEERIIPTTKIDAVTVTNQLALTSIQQGTSIIPTIKYKLVGGTYKGLTNEAYRIEIADKTILKYDYETTKFKALALGVTSFCVIMTGPGGVEVKSAPIFVRVEQTANPRNDIELIVRQLNAVAADETATPEQKLGVVDALETSYNYNFFQNTIENAVTFMYIIALENLDPNTTTELQLQIIAYMAPALIEVENAASNTSNAIVLRYVLFDDPNAIYSFRITTPFYNILSDANKATVMEQLYQSLNAIVNSGKRITKEDIAQIEVFAAAIAPKGIFSNSINICIGDLSFNTIQGEGGRQTVRTTYVNNSNENSAYYIVAVISDKLLIDVKIIPKTFNPGETFYTFNCELNLPSVDICENLEIKTMLWRDIKKPIPLSKPLLIGRYYKNGQ